MSIPAIINPVYPVRPSGGQQDQASRYNQQNRDSDASRQELQARRERPTSEFIYRGELLDSVEQQRRYRPQPDQQISAKSRIAIERYLASEALAADYDPRGRLLDRFV